MIICQEDKRRKAYCYESGTSFGECTYYLQISYASQYLADVDHQTNLKNRGACMERSADNHDSQKSIPPRDNP